MYIVNQNFSCHKDKILPILKCKKKFRPKTKTQNQYLKKHCVIKNESEPEQSFITRRQTIFKSISSCSCVVCARKSGWYDKFFAYGLEHWTQGYMEKISPFKEILFPQIKNSEDFLNILEIGIGSGPNLNYYAKNKTNLNITGLDPNIYMEPYLLEKAEALNLKDKVSFVEGCSESMPFADKSFDYVIATTVLCSVNDVTKSLQEVKRVLNENGKFIFIEHVIALPNTSTRFWQTILNPLQVKVADGCNLTRDTLKYIESAGFSKIDAKRVEIKDLSIIAPHIYGTAYI